MKQAKYCTSKKNKRVRAHNMQMNAVAIGMQNSAVGGCEKNKMVI